MKNKFCLIFTICIILTNFAKAQTAPSAVKSTYKNEFGFRSDNDSYLAQGSDMYYTNGLFIHFRHATKQENLKENLEKKIFEISLGQKIYNPRSGYSPNPDRQDRPFAGYLYAGAALSWYSRKEGILKMAVELGTTGPNSLAQAGQELLHNTIGFYELAGWEYQIKNEASINLSAQYTKLISRAEDNTVDVSFEGYANAGTTFNAAGAGFLFRIGRINQLFNSGATNSVISNQQKTKSLMPRELFFYTRPQLNYIIYDATAQGSMFNNDSPVTYGIQPIVFEQKLGLNYSSPRFTFDFGVYLRTKEVRSKAPGHQFGSISLYYRFD
ncbi:MAG: lipid A deacylase LpxR family protein [Pedobacter sp.]|nr:MAG: lipid A deacylase LpxR family protein [Pedobacter sp.]